MKEVWRHIPGFSWKYDVSTLGRVRSLKHRFGWRNKPRLCRGHISTNGYLRARLYSDGKIYYVSIHRAVATCFIGPIAKGRQVRHLDGNKSNNRLSNLAIGTAKENGEDNVRLGVQPAGENHGMAILSQENVDDIRRLYGVGLTQVEIGRLYKITQVHVSKIVTRKIWKTKS